MKKLLLPVNLQWLLCTYGLWIYDTYNLLSCIVLNQWVHVILRSLEYAAYGIVNTSHVIQYVSMPVQIHVKMFEVWWLAKVVAAAWNIHGLGEANHLWHSCLLLILLYNTNTGWVNWWLWLYQTNCLNSGVSVESATISQIVMCITLDKFTQPSKSHDTTVRGKVNVTSLYKLV
jgi:hypothetical protein